MKCVRIRHGFVWAVWGATLFACNTTSFLEYDTPNYVNEVLAEYADDAPKDILVRIIEKTPLKGFSLIAKFLDAGVITKDIADEASSAVGTILQEHFSRAMKDEAYEEALRIYNNLSIIGYSDLAYQRTDIIQNIIKSADSAENYPLVTEYASILFWEDMTIFLNTENKLLKHTLTAIEHYPDLDLIEDLCSYNELRTLDSAKSLPCTSSDKDTRIASMEQILRSTFVVDVDKGITIAKDGAGLAREIGSAFFITSDGYALTNYHVIRSEVDPTYEGKSDLHVRLKSDDFQIRRPGKVVGYDPLIDLALIKVSHTPSHVIPITSDDNIDEGDEITVIGSPIGLVNSVTSGILSAKGRRLLDVGGVLQVDASVNQGNSGGPLLNESRELVGVIFSKIPEFENLNFAIPSSMVKMVIPDLFKGGEIEHSWFGIGVHEVENGFIVLYIAPNSPAEKANMKAYDIITHINGEEVENIIDFQTTLLNVGKGSIYNVTVLRDENSTTEKREVFIVTDIRNDDPFVGYASGRSLHKIFPILSGALVEVTRFGGKPEYRITRVLPDSQAEYVGLTPGDLISVMRVERHERYIAVALKILQQSRGFLTDGVVFRLDVSSRNFI